MPRCLLLMTVLLGTLSLPGCAWYYGFQEKTSANTSYSDQYRHDRSTVERMEASEPD